MLKLNCGATKYKCGSSVTIPKRKFKCRRSYCYHVSHIYLISGGATLTLFQLCSSLNIVNGSVYCFAVGIEFDVK